MKVQNSHSPIERLGAALSYALPSLAVMFANKALFSLFDFRYSRFLTLIQFAFSAIFLFTLKSWGVVVMKDLSWPVMKSTLLLALFFLLNTMLGLTALGGENLPMFAALRHLGILFVLPLEIFILHRKPSAQAYLAVSIIVLGTIIAAFNDLTFEIHAYAVVFVANMVTALYLILIKRSASASQLSPFDLLYNNTIVALPMLFLFFVLSDEPKEIMSLSVWQEPTFLLTLGVSVFSAALCELGMYNNTTVNSPMTQNVVGVLKNAIATILGMFLNDYKYDFFNVIGVLVNMFGGFYFSYLKVTEQDLLQTKNKIIAKPLETSTIPAEKHDLQHVVYSTTGVRKSHAKHDEL